MTEFDKFILQQFSMYCDKNQVNIHKAAELRMAGVEFVHQIENRVIDFIEWSIEDDRNKYFNEIINSIDDGMPEDFYSIDLQNAYVHLGYIIGEEISDDVADEIFSKFCMGK